MKIYPLALVVALLSPLVTKASTTPLHPKITLKSIEAVKLVEKRGDELYFNITEFGQGSKNRHYRIPHKPSYWLSSYLKNVNNVVVWDAKLNAGDSTVVIIELVEHDAPPWNLDDLIGAVTVKINNENGKLNYNWHRFDTQEDIIGNLEKDEFSFDMKNNHGDYKLDFVLEK